MRTPIITQGLIDAATGADLLLQDDLSELVDQSGARQLALYHLVPPPSNALFERIFVRGLPEDTIVTADGMIFELPSGSAEVRVVAP